MNRIAIAAGKVVTVSLPAVIILEMTAKHQFDLNKK